MSYGILENRFSRGLFEEINSRRICKEKCWPKRSNFCTKDKKRHDCRSNLVSGFSSEKISAPLAI